MSFSSNELITLDQNMAMELGLSAVCNDIKHHAHQWTSSTNTTQGSVDVMRNGQNPLISITDLEQ